MEYNYKTLLKAGLSISFLLFSIIKAGAQDTIKSEKYVYLFSGSLIPAKQVTFKSPFFGSNYILADSVKFNPVNVKFYKNEKGFYANIVKASPMLEGKFAERTDTGKINIFEYTTSTYSPGFSGAGGMYGGSYSSRTRKYYNKGTFGDLKRLNYKNLSTDLADNLQSMFSLKRYKDNSDAQITFGIIGGALLLGAFISTMNKVSDSNTPEGTKDIHVNTEIGIAIIGAGCWTVTALLKIPKKRRLQEAIDTYNK